MKEYEGENQKDLRVESRLMSHIPFVVFVPLCLRGYLRSIQSGFISRTHSFDFSDSNDSSLRFCRVILRPVGRPEV